MTANEEEGVWAREVAVSEDIYRSRATGASFSGGERNFMFFGGLSGHQFVDLSGVSGADDQHSRAH